MGHVRVEPRKFPTTVLILFAVLLCPISLISAVTTLSHASLGSEHVGIGDKEIPPRPVITPISQKAPKLRASFSVTGSIPVGSGPGAIAYDPAKGELFVANSGSNNVSVVSDTTDSVIATVPVGEGPSSIAYDSAREELFVVNGGGSDNISVISDTSNKVVDTIPLAVSATVPGQAVYDSGRGEIFVSQPNSNVVGVINDTNDKVVDSIPVGAYPCGVTYDSKKGEIFVVENHANSVGVINDTTYAVVATIPFGTFTESYVYDSSKGEVFVNEDPFQPGPFHLGVISDSNNSLVDSILLKGVTNEEGGLAYDSGDGDIFDTISGTNGPALDAGYNITVVSDSTDTVVQNLTLGHGPNAIAVDNGTGEIFVTNSLSDNVSVIKAGAIPPPPPTVSFTETGLPTGITWSVDLAGVVHTSPSTTISFQEPNGTYRYTIASTSGFGPTPANGSVVVVGMPIEIPVTFERVFALTFTATGLSPGTNWSVDLVGPSSSVILARSLDSSGTSLDRYSDGSATVVFYTSNGTYSYSAAAPGRANWTGTVTVSGAATAAPPVNFSPSSSSSPWLDYAVIAAVVIVIAVVAGVSLMRIRRKTPPSATAQWQPSAGQPPSSQGQPWQGPQGPPSAPTPYPQGPTPPPPVQ
jgi:YVTN family beta-propeller protein